MPLFQLNKSRLSLIIKEEAKRLGFEATGISKAEFAKEDAKRMESWLEKGHHGEMGYLERNKEKRYDAGKLVESAKSVITVLYNYFPEEELPESTYYKISKYAYGKDYHYVGKEKLKQLLKKIELLTGERIARVFTDSAPLLDRANARKSGLGFIGKNTMLINRKIGSFFFIGHILIDLELTEDEETITNFCGSCTKCIQACPTQALKPFELNANKCISYLTIEYRGDKIPEEFNGKWNRWIFGCDICQDVCPWNRGIKPHNEPLFKAKENLKKMTKTDWENMNSTLFKELFKGTALERTKFKGLKRNIDFLKKNNL